MDPLSITASVVALLTISEAILNTCYRFVGKVKDAESEVNTVLGQVGSLRVILEDLRRACEEEEDKGTSKRLEAALGGDGGSLARLGKCLDELKARLAGAAGPMNFRRKLQWPLDSKKAREVLDRIKAEIPLIELAVVGDSHAMTVDMRNAVEETERRKEREAVLNWLCCTDPTVKHVASRKLHQPGSNSWVLDAAAFKEWTTTPGQDLWLHGIPGAGKTIICSTIIDHIEGTICKGRPERRLAYYYFDFANQSTQDLSSLLRCLLWQLCSQDDLVSAPVLALYAECDSGRKEASDEMLASALFAEARKGGRRAFVILDAVDECPPEERERFFDLLLEHTAGPELSTANFLFTSRKEHDIEEPMSELGEVVKLHIVPIFTGDVAADIRLYVAHQLSTRRSTRNWDKGLRKDVEDTIADAADGMFRWAYCQLDLIKNCKQVRKVRETLKSQPKTLDATYDRILASIPDETADIALSALMLLAYSARPMTIQEVAEAMVVDHQRRTFSPDEDRLTNCREVLEICGSLVTVVILEKNPLAASERIPWLTEKKKIEGMLWGTDTGHLEIVQFAHFTVKEYIVLERSRALAKIERYSFSAAQAHQAITKLSLVYLLAFGRGQRVDTIDFVGFPFLAYAARYWTEHWQRQLGGKKGQEDVNRLIRRLFDAEREPNGYINYLNIYRPDTVVHGWFRWSTRQAKSLEALPQPLYYAAGLGHPELCQWLIVDKGCDVNSCRGVFGHAIQFAARLGHSEVVRLLLDHGADVHTLAGACGYALHAAAFGGHVEILGILLERGADVNAYGGGHGTALIAACTLGHMEAVRLLLDHGADVNRECTHGSNALSAAAKTGNKAMMQLLLDRGGKLNDDSLGAEGHALYTAAREGHVDLVKFLVAAGADVNFWSKGEGTALMAACGDGRGKVGAADDGMARQLEIVRYLLQHGADPNIRDERRGDALQAAVKTTAGGNAVGYNIDLITLLLEAGIDINYRAGTFDSAIWATILYGNTPAAHALLDRGVTVDDEVFLLAVGHREKTVTPRLLAKGVDVNAENEAGSALCLAIQNQDQTTIDHLLSDPAIDINALTGRNGETALYHAASSGNIELTRRLLGLGADARVPCGNGDTCLIPAVNKGDMAMVELLLKSGADVNAGCPTYKTPLTAACKKANEPLVRFLLDQGADVNPGVPAGGQDPLQAAAYTGDETIVKLLLARGADVKSPEGYHGSCLECAISRRSPAVTRLLLDAGANINFSRPPKDFDKMLPGVGGALSAAIRYPQEGLVPLLIERGAAVNFPGSARHGTPLMQAIELGRDDDIELLLKSGANVNQVGGTHGCALMHAILKPRRNPDDNLVQRLLHAGAEINIQCGEYGCPLAAAIRTSNLPLVEKLLDLGADVNAAAGKHGSPLMVAVSEGDIDVFRLLLARGANVNAVSQGGLGSALEVAADMKAVTMFNELLENGADAAVNDSAAVVACARVGNIDGLIALLDRGANLHIQQGVPGKALHLAAHERQLGTVRILLERGVDVNSTGGKHGNALMAALSALYFQRTTNSIEPTVELLLDAGANVNSPPSEIYTSALHTAIRHRHFRVAQRLIDDGADVNAHDPRFGTALTAASSNGVVDWMKRLVQMGADPSLESTDGSALQVAARSGSLPGTRYLLSLPTVDVNQYSGNTGFALHNVCRFGGSGEMVQLLLDHGADVNARGVEYGTALQEAAANGHLEAVKLLIRHGADATIEGGKFGSPLRASLAEGHYPVANYLRRHLAKVQAQAAAKVAGVPD